MDPSAIVLIVFLSVYACFVFLPERRTAAVLAGAFIVIATRSISLHQAFFAVNWNVMGIFAGTLVLADIFMASRVPAYLAEIIVDKARNTCWAILFICLMTGLISAFVENVATVLIVAPVALALSKKLNINPANMMISIAISSNLQGAATLIGDPPSMLLAGFCNMDFTDFFFYKGRPGIFFAVEIAALVSMFVLYLFFRKYRSKQALIPVEKVKSWIPSVFLLSLIALLAVSSFFDTGFSYLAGIICAVFGVIAALWKRFADRSSILEGLRKLDWDTALFLIGVFILVGAFTATGWIDVIAGFLSETVADNIFAGYTAIVFLSVFVSAFVDNVPFLAAMLPVAVSMSAKLNMEPTIFLFGLLVGASIGGNITPIGASANIVACSLLKKEGHNVGFLKFARIGLPFTMAAVLAAYLFIWFVWR